MQIIASYACTVIFTSLSLLDVKSWCVFQIFSWSRLSAVLLCKFCSEWLLTCTSWFLLNSLQKNCMKEQIWFSPRSLIIQLLFVLFKKFKVNTMWSRIVDFSFPNCCMLAKNSIDSDMLKWTLLCSLAVPFHHWQCHHDHLLFR